MEPLSTSRPQSTANPTANTAPDPALDLEGDISIENTFSDVIGIAKLSESPDSIYHYFVASPMYAGFGNLNSPDRLYFLDYINSASPALKNYLTSADTVEVIFSTGKEHDLEDHQITDLGILIRELLTGKVFIQEFPTTMALKLNIADNIAGEIANKLISQSFVPIIEDIKRLQRSKFPDKIQQLQKQSQQPQILTQQPSPQTNNPQPLTRNQSSQQSNPSQANTVPQTNSATPVFQQPQQVRPQAANTPNPVTPPQSQTQNRPPLSMPPRPVSIPQPEKIIPVTNQTTTKIPPDLSALGTIGIVGKTSSPQSPADKAFETALEKVAGVIDLRNSSEN